MDSFGSVAWSSVGKKVIMGLTGLFIFCFVIVHLIGNMTLLIGPDAFNNYAHFLETLLHGWFIYVFEAGMLVLFLLHIVSAVNVAWVDKFAARKTGYKYSKNAGGRSRKTISSVTMIYGGLLLAVFIIAHIWLFKFGDHEVYGNDRENLYKTVVTAFKNPGFVVFTVVAMIFLGLHLRHGLWSAFQSLGWANDRYLPVLERLALVAAWIFAVGYICLPVLMYFIGDPNTLPGGHH